MTSILAVKNLHSELKLALKASRQTLTEFANNLQKPDNTTGVSHTYVIRVAQGSEHTQYIITAIENYIAEAKRKYPDFYKEQARACPPKL